MAANKSRHKDGITHLGLEHQPKEGNSLRADGKKHAPVTSFLRADGPGIASLLLALAPEGPGQAPGEMVFHRTHTHHEKMELIPRLGNPSPAVLWSSRVRTVARGQAPLNVGPIRSSKVMELWHRSVEDGDPFGKTKPDCSALGSAGHSGMTLSFTKERRSGGHFTWGQGQISTSL